MTKLMSISISINIMYQNHACYIILDSGRTPGFHFMAPVASDQATRSPKCSSLLLCMYMHSCHILPFQPIL